MAVFCLSTTGNMPLIIEIPQITVSPDMLNELEKFTADQGQVVIHGIIKSSEESTFVRIWPTTFLFDRNSTHISELVHFEKISGFPVWTEVRANSEFGFTLIFSGLPRSCTIFDLCEIIPQTNGCTINSILRNDRDVYYLDFS